MSRREPRMAVVVPTRDRPGKLSRLLEGLAQQTLPTEQWEAVVVDDGSAARAAAHLRALAQEAPFRLRVLSTGMPAGPAAARNLGWRATRAALLAFTDDDCYPRPGWLAAGVAALEAQPRVGIAQGRTERPPGSECYPYTPFTVVREVLQPSPWFEGCNLFLRREAVEACGGFDESLKAFGEETSLGWRVIEAGWERAWVPGAVVEHEITERPWSWHLRIHYEEGTLVALAARHPAMRKEFWRPWAVKRENALFAALVGGALAGLRCRPAWLLALPYLAWLSPGRRVGPLGAAQQVSVHAASLAGKLAAGVKARSFLL